MGISFTDLQPGQFAATSIEGGLPKLVRIWEDLRRLNKGGYGGAVLVQLGDFTKASAEGVTSCSPFTCTAICMALDPRSVDVGQPYTLAASQAKYYASEVAVRAANAAVQVHGGYGYIDEFPVERHYRDVRASTLYEGTSEVQRLVISREVLRD